MQQRSSSPPPAFVPFVWEEKPGIPKTQEIGKSLLFTTENPNEQQYSAFQHPILPLSKPPCLEPHYGVPLRKTTSFSTIPAPRLPHHSSSLLSRKQFFDGGDQMPFTRKYSHGSLLTPPPQQIKRILRERVEDDPFFMAMQACRKKPNIRVSFHRNKGSELKETNTHHVLSGGHGNLEQGSNFKHLTIRQLFTQQLQEEERLHMAQRQPLILKKKKANNIGPFTFLARCLGCY